MVWSHWDNQSQYLSEPTTLLSHTRTTTLSVMHNNQCVSSLFGTCSIMSETSIVQSHHILLGVEGVMISCSRKWYTSRGSWFITLDTQHRGPCKSYILYFSCNVPGKCGTKASLRLLALASLRLEVEQSLGTQDDHSDHGPTRHSWVQGTKQLENYMHDSYLKSLVSKTMYNSRNYADVVRTTKRRRQTFLFS